MTDTVSPAEQDWYFTFGSGQQHDGHYVVIRGTWITARDEMARHFGNRWSFQYPTREAAGVDEFGLPELPRDQWATPDLRQRFAAELHRIADDVIRLELPLGRFLTLALGVLDSRADLQRWADYLGGDIDEDGGSVGNIPNIDHRIPFNDKRWGPALAVRAQIQPDQQSEVERLRARVAELESKTDTEQVTR